MKKKLFYFAVISLIIMTSCNRNKTVQKSASLGDDWQPYTVRIDTFVQKSPLPAQYMLKGNLDLVYFPTNDSITVDDSGRVVFHSPTKMKIHIAHGTMGTLQNRTAKIKDLSGREMDVMFFSFSDEQDEEVLVPFVANGKKGTDEYSIKLLNPAEVDKQEKGKQSGKVRLGDGYLYVYLLNYQKLMYSRFVSTNGNKVDAKGSLVPGRK